MTTAIQKSQAVTTVKTLVSQPDFQNRFKEVLGNRAPQFVSSLINVSNSMGDCEPYSVVQSAMVAAALDLPIDRNLGFAWIVPYGGRGGKSAQFQMGYKGYIQLALRTGRYERMNARTINREAFVGYDDVGEPKIDWSKIDETADVFAYVFAFKMVNGFTKVCMWTKERIEVHAKRYSQSYKSGADSPWKSNFDKMALKTVVKNELASWGILSIEMQNAIEKDQAVIDAEGNAQFIDNEAEPEKTPSFKKTKTVEATVVKKDPVNPPAPANPTPQAEPPPAPETTKPEPSEPPQTQTAQAPAVTAPVTDEISRLKEAMADNGVTDEMVIAFAKEKNLLAQGADPDLATLSDIIAAKVPILTKNIAAKGIILKQIKGEA